MTGYEGQALCLQEYVAISLRSINALTSRIRTPCPHPKRFVGLVEAVEYAAD